MLAPPGVEFSVEVTRSREAELFRFEIMDALRWSGLNLRIGGHFITQSILCN